MEALLLTSSRFIAAALGASLLLGPLSAEARPRRADPDVPNPEMVERVGRPLTGYPDQNKELMRDPATVWSRYRITGKEYFAQPNEWTCSSSCYIMMFRALVDSDLSLLQAIERTGAKEGSGAPNSQVVAAFEMLGPRYQIVTGQSSISQENLSADDPRLREEKAQQLQTLRRLLDEGYLVMMNFREPVEQVGHYGILQGLNDTAIEIADPYYGRRSVMSLDKFDYRSGFSSPVLHGWYLAVRRAGDGAKKPGRNR